MGRTVRCPGCGKGVTAFVGVPGEKLTCPSCGTSIHLPDRPNEFPLSAPKGIRHFFTKVVGVTFANSDGVSRQEIIRKCRILEKVELHHERDNPVDANAICVCCGSGSQIGHLRADLAEELVAESRKQKTHTAFISSLTGGTCLKPTLGVNLLIVVSGPEVREEEVAQYAQAIAIEDSSTMDGELEWNGEIGGSSGASAHEGTSSACCVLSIARGCVLLCLILAAGILALLLFAGGPSILNQTISGPIHPPEPTPVHPVEHQDNKAIPMNSARQQKETAMPVLAGPERNHENLDRANVAGLGLQMIAAARAGDFDQVQALLNQGADVDTKDEFGKTALDYARDGGHRAVARILAEHKVRLRRGADGKKADRSPTK